MTHISILPTQADPAFVLFFSFAYTRTRGRGKTNSKRVFGVFSIWKQILVQFVSNLVCKLYGCFLIWMQVSILKWIEKSQVDKAVVSKFSLNLKNISICLLAKFFCSISFELLSKVFCVSSTSSLVFFVIFSIDSIFVNVPIKKVVGNDGKLSIAGAPILSGKCSFLFCKNTHLLSPEMHSISCICSLNPKNKHKFDEEINFMRKEWQTSGHV